MLQQARCKTGDDSTTRIKSRRDMGGRFPSIVFISCVGPLYITHSKAMRGIAPTQSQEEAPQGWGGGAPIVVAGVRRCDGCSVSASL